ncbi:hypothetical protein EST38_g10497 [Candolleomyces aberdarensis]|uniref:Cytochrome P450 n=1 Tax=Candolleomyces aberdarensis TaxID=2316362 RepID=A0A4Q2D7Y1_9AGAR|nr:hypothetical protein EST38_g10497 [Candolleomyces aberdarensis]
MDFMNVDTLHPMLVQVSAGWRKTRRVAHHSLHPVSIKEYRPQIIKSTRAFLKRLLNDPDPFNIIPHIRHLAGETILSIDYGLQIQEENDPYLEMSLVGLQTFADAAVPGAFLVDSFPLLKDVPAWLPGASFKRKASAIVYETLRWRDVAPTGVPHLLSTEDEYEGYRLRAGASSFQTLGRAMLHDETMYPDPFTFNPDRFINPDTGQVDFMRARDPSHACWGYGRRICPGRHMAFSSIWLAIASLISMFNSEKVKEKVRVVGEDVIGWEEERTVELTHEYVSGLAVMPKPFKCVIKPRSKEKAGLICEPLIQDHD